MIARQLFDGELIERFVFVERVDYPITPDPHDGAVEMVAAGIGVAGQSSQAPSARRNAATRADGQPTFRKPSNFIREEGVNFFNRRRQTREVQ